jgi:hypothetical protein
MRLTRCFVLLGSLTAAACGATPSAGDAGADAGADAGRDAGQDAGRPDAGPLPACGSDTALALSQCVEVARYEADLATIALPRVPASAHWREVQDLCATRLEGLGFTVERQSYGTGVNVVGVREGTTEPARRVLLAAHYDHVSGCDGADDNASGVAGALEAARVLVSASYPRTLVVACWDEEERGLVGSRAYAARARADGDTIDASFNFEMIGYRDSTPNTQTLPTGFRLLFREAAVANDANGRRADFVAVIGDPASSGAMASLQTYADRIGLRFVALPLTASLLESPLTGDLKRSDHAAFWEQGYPAMMVTDTGEFRYDRYHCAAGPDVPANLDAPFAGQIVSISVAAAAEALGL